MRAALRTVEYASFTVHATRFAGTSLSAHREAVILDGNYQTNELISIYASGIVIADVTLMRAYDHAIHITGPGAPISGVQVHNVHIVDPGQQAIKINPDGTGLGVTIDSVIECSHLELTDMPIPFAQVSVGLGFFPGTCALKDPPIIVETIEFTAVQCRRVLQSAHQHEGLYENFPPA